mmetsp:Transcript_11788/g.18084  ORF Transcript_11788/g.18084 Transcript_11788/m.18084 type:complete len:242 (+) Transcript_11788:2147-2872(+)
MHQLSQSDSASVADSEGSSPEAPQPYDNLFKNYDFQKLRQVAKTIFQSPIDNWKLFSFLKKRLELAFDLKTEMATLKKHREDMVQGKPAGHGAKMEISRILPYIEQYHTNCRVKGLPEIDQTLALVEDQADQVELLADQASNKVISLDGGQYISREKALSWATKMKAKLNSLHFDFEEQDREVLRLVWIVQLHALKLEVEGADREDESDSSEASSKEKNDEDEEGNADMDDLFGVEEESQK